MSESKGPHPYTAGHQNSASDQEPSSDGRADTAQARSDISSGAEDEDGPSSPHFYSLSVRQSSSMDSLQADTLNTAPDSFDDHNTDDSIKENADSEQQVHEQAVRLDQPQKNQQRRVHGSCTSAV